MFAALCGSPIVTSILPRSIAAYWLGLALGLGGSLFASGDLRKEAARGNKLVYRGKYEEALAVWEGVVAKDPGNVQGLLQLGNCQSMLTRFEEAEATFRRALSLEPKNPSVLLSVGLLYFRQGLHGQAEEYLRKTLAARSWQPQAYYHLGLIYEKRGDKSKAIQCYVKELENNNRCSAAWHHFMVLRSEGKRNRMPDRVAIGIFAGCMGFSGLMLLFAKLLNRTRSKPELAGVDERAWPEQVPEQV